MDLSIRQWRVPAMLISRALRASVVAAAILGPVACDRLPGIGKDVPAPAAAPPPPPVVEIVEAELRTVQPTFDIPAVIEALEFARVRPQVTATVIARHLTPGSLVEQGDLLFELDDSDFLLVLAETEAALQQALANSEQTRADWERAQALKPKGAISTQDHDRAQARHRIAEAQLRELEARLNRVKLDLGHTKVYAPFSGKISAAYYAVGDYVSPSSPDPLCEIVRLDPIYALAQVDQRRYDEFILKREELVARGASIPELRLTMRLSSGFQYPHEGVFENWDHSAVASTGSMGGRVRFPNPGGMLLPGLNVTLHGHVIDAVERVVIPQTAVSQDQQGHYVLTVGADDVVERKNVEVGIRIGRDWAVRNGLEPGDRVIVAGLQKVRPGLKVDSKAASSAS